MRRFAINQESPFRSPAWRWKLALGFLQGRERRLSRWDDPWFRRAVLHLRNLRTQKPRTRGNSRPDQAVADALSIFRATQSTRALRIEARILARQSPTEIADAENLPPGVVAAYEACFFDVRSKLHADGYIRNHAIGLDPNTAQPHSWPAFVRMAAYAGGPQVLDAAFRSALPIPQGVPVDPLTCSFRCLWLLQNVSATTLSPATWKELERLVSVRLGPGKTIAPIEPAARLADLVARSSAVNRCVVAENTEQNRQFG
jgi:hypothetical protein